VKDPSDIEGEEWCTPGDDGEWGADQSMAVTSVPPANDKFVQLRMSIDGELQQLGLTTTESIKQLWKKLDYNGNNIVSLAEIDKMVVEMVASGTGPHG